MDVDVAFYNVMVALFEDDDQEEAFSGLRNIVRWVNSGGFMPALVSEFARLCELAGLKVLVLA